jgi:hypothetical protein
MAKREKDIDKKLEGKLLKLMPGLPNLGEQFMNRIRCFDGSEPKTLIAGLKADFRNFTKMLNGKEHRIGRLVSWLLRIHWLQKGLKSQMSIAIALAKRQTVVDRRYSLLLKLIHKVDAHAPLLAIFADLLHYANPERMLDPQCRPLRFLQEAEREKGEKRAIAVVHALKSTAEALYKPYVATVWRLSYLKEGILPPTPPNFGPMLDVAYQRLSDYGGLIEPDAVFRRNAAVHEQHEYLLEKDALKMWDDNHPPIEVSVGDLLAMVNRMYDISAKTIVHVAQIYMLRDVLVNTGIWDTFIECLPLALSGDQTKIDDAEQRLVARAETVIEPLQEFFTLRGIQ